MHPFFSVQILFGCFNLKGSLEPKNKNVGEKESKNSNLVDELTGHACVVKQMNKSNCS